jgi:endonuclease-8
MPEGDTLHRIARALQVLVGERVTSLVLPRQAGLGRSIAGAVVDEVVAVGKNLVTGFDTGLCLHTHLQMHGAWHLYGTGQRWRRPSSTAVAVLTTARLQAVCFGAPVVRLIERRRIERELADVVAVDVLGDHGVFDLDDVLRRLRARDDVDLGVALLDQRAIAGVGNVYKSEVLFRLGLDPFAPVSAVDDDRLGGLVLLLRQLMQKNVDGRDPLFPRAARVTVDTKAPARPSSPVAVYGKAGRPCPVCGTPIAMRRQGELPRSTYFCPQCQPARAPR